MMGYIESCGEMKEGNWREINHEGTCGSNIVIQKYSPRGNIMAHTRTGP